MPEEQNEQTIRERAQHAGGMGDKTIAMLADACKEFSNAMDAVVTPENEARFVAAFQGLVMAFGIVGMAAQIAMAQGADAHTTATPDLSALLRREGPLN